MATGEPAERVLPALGKLEGVKGRLEVMGLVRGGLVVIDYAHKPDALAAALAALRPFAPGRLVCVFGCGGDRDKGKRPIMGRIAATMADTVIVTDDNPRSEDAEAIRAEILAGAPGAREIGDRAEAIQAGARLLGAGDVLLIAGKGHETGQIIGDTVVPFSDHEAVRALITEPRVAMTAALWHWDELVAAAQGRRGRHACGRHRGLLDRQPHAVAGRRVRGPQGRARRPRLCRRCLRGGGGRRPGFGGLSARQERRGPAARRRFARRRSKPSAAPRAFAAMPASSP